MRCGHVEKANTCSHIYIRYVHLGACVGGTSRFAKASLCLLLLIQVVAIVEKLKFVYNFGSTEMRQWKLKLYTALYEYV